MFSQTPAVFMGLTYRVNCQKLQVKLGQVCLQHLAEARIIIKPSAEASYINKQRREVAPWCSDTASFWNWVFEYLYRQMNSLRLSRKPKGKHMSNRSVEMKLLSRFLSSGDAKRSEAYSHYHGWMWSRSHHSEKIQDWKTSIKGVVLCSSSDLIASDVGQQAEVLTSTDHGDKKERIKLN